ncbi:glycosyl transferase [Mobiluncus mulieris]|uniref:Glycosyl transferase n=1 Tax=Mobiluncus mulieris TaxID=2052 RepID=A0A7Y0U1K7_9ACTO|nr:glycosyl transferase [Mobiluncus mulieris]NMW65279.1 glycosyl transferase [Mobiluncus mulieris]
MNPNSDPPSVTVVIACHDPKRPLRRAVASVLQSRAAKVLVVAHNLEAVQLAAVLDKDVSGSGRGAGAGRLSTHPRVEILELCDGLHSPAGPFNYGLSRVQTRFAAIMGSDDFLDPGAVDVWVALAKRYHADMVITRLQRGGRDARRPVHTPPVRPWLRGLADFRRDRLYYRSAPLGLMRVSRLRELGLEMTPGLAVGEDIAFSMRLYASSRVVVQRRGLGYVVGEDGPARVTLQSRPIAEELGHVTDLLGRAWAKAWPVAVRRAVAAKTLRIHVFGVVLNRERDWWDVEQRQALAAITRELLDFAPGCERVFSRADTALLAAILNPTIPVDVLRQRAQARRRFLSFGALMPAHREGWFAAEGPWRFAAASFLVQ